MSCSAPAAARWAFLQVADALTANSGRERTSAFVYPVGWTQHTVGVQYIRTASILQSLLGNMGRPGGGILALPLEADLTKHGWRWKLTPGYPCRKSCALT